MDSTTQTILARAWTALVEATADRTPFTHGYFGTVGLDGEPQVRTVILRGADIEASTVFFASQAGASKIAEIEREPRVAFTFYDEHADLQVRLTGRAEVAVDSFPGDDANRYAMVAVGVETLETLDLTVEPYLRHRFVIRDGEWDGIALAP